MQWRSGFMLRCVMVGALALLCSLTAARASLIGDTVNAVTVSTGNPNHDLGNVVVGPGIEFSPSSFRIDFAANTVTFSGVPNIFTTFFNSAFNGYVLSDITNPFTSVSIDPLTSVAGFTASNLSLSGGQIIVNFSSLTFNGGGTATPFTEVVLDITTVSAVPEPATLALFGGGLVGLMGLLRRRKDAA